MIRRIQQASGTKYIVYGYANGKQKYVGSFDSQKVAKLAEETERVTQREIKAGERAPKLDLKRTLSMAVTEWLASLKAQGSRSLSIYTRRMNQAILPVLGSVSVARITSANVIRWRDNYVREVSPATVNATIGTLSSAFEWFGTMQWVDENPVHGVKRFEENTPQFEWLRTPSRSRDCWRRVPSRSARSSP